MRQVQLTLFALLFIPCLSFGDVVRYYLQADDSNPLKVNVKVDTSSLGAFSVNPPRNRPFSKMGSALEISCKTESGIIKVTYKKAVQCNEIRWTVDFKLLDNSRGADVSEQVNLYSTEGWWVLFEWESVPRLNNYPIVVCVQPLSTEYPDKCRNLPKPDSAPLILSWGRASATSHESNANFSVYADDKQRVLSNRNWSFLKSQYEYLQKLISVEDGNIENIDIIWVGIDENAGIVGGAAGDQAFVSNYAFKDGGVSEDNLMRLRWVSGHEIFHMLSSASYPLWLSESLAHYYGYKSLRKAGARFQTPIEVWRSRLGKLVHSEIGLYTANEMVESNNDMSYYDLFYDKGAAFWQELDDSLIEKGASLDDYIALLSRENADSPLLGREFVNEIGKVVGKNKFSYLSAKYLE